MLKIENLNVKYGGIHALRGIDMQVPENKIITLIGANGAGKSTTLKSIIGLVKPSSGSIKYKGNEIAGLKAKDNVKSGIVLVPEGRRVFSNLSVEENLKLGAYIRKDKNNISKDLKWCYELFPILHERKWQKAGTMSGGEQQMLAVARGLMARPEIMMMDEPSLGLAPLIVKDIFNIIKEIYEEHKMTILLIEQNAKAALEIAHYGYVLETGKITLQGSGAQLLDDERVQNAYLGEAQSVL